MEYPIANGVGLKCIHYGNEPWYGNCSCGVCGSQKIIPMHVRWWDCDDGWRSGVLCLYCAEDCQMRGPQEDDYAMLKRSSMVGQGDSMLERSSITREQEQADRLDIAAELLGDDIDGAWSMGNE
jgi:hypothetical protein